MSEFLDLNLEYHNEEGDKEDDVTNTVSYYRNMILKEVKTVSLELEAIATSFSPIAAGRKVTAAPMLKLEKLKCPKLSGHSQDYG